MKNHVIKHQKSPNRTISLLTDKCSSIQLSFKTYNIPILKLFKNMSERVIFERAFEEYKKRPKYRREQCFAFMRLIYFLRLIYFFIIPLVGLKGTTLCLFISNLSWLSSKHIIQYRSSSQPLHFTKSTV